MMRLLGSSARPRSARGASRANLRPPGPGSPRSGAAPPTPILGGDSSTHRIHYLPSPELKAAPSRRRPGLFANPPSPAAQARRQHPVRDGNDSRPPQ